MDKCDGRLENCGATTMQEYYDGDCYKCRGEMMDKIREITVIGNLLEGYESESKFVGNEAYDNLLKQTEKEIRQQIGLELHIELTKAVIDNPHSDTAYGVNIGLEKAAIAIAKVCKLEEE
jgi:tRNA U54 and U55 pseudouridine synthase Pus10